MNTSVNNNTSPKKAYYRLLASSHQRAQHLIAKTKTDPKRQRDTMAYVKQLQKEMKQFAENHEHPGPQQSQEVKL